MDLEAKLAGVVRRFTAEIAAILAELPARELVELSAKQAARDVVLRRHVGPDATKPRKRRKKYRYFRQRSKRSPADIRAVAKKVVGIVEEVADGVSAGELMKELRLTRNKLLKPVEIALHEGWISKKGIARGTRYFPPKAKAA